MYEVLKTEGATLTVRLRAATLEQLFAEAGEAVMDLAVDHPVPGPESETITFAFRDADAEDLLHEWLNELLHLHQTRQVVLGDFHVVLSDRSLEAEARAERLDPACHGGVHAITGVARDAVELAKRGEEQTAQFALSGGTDEPPPSGPPENR